MQLHFLLFALFAFFASFTQAALPTVTVTVTATATATVVVTSTVQSVNTWTVTATTVITVFGKSSPMMMPKGSFVPAANLVNILPAGVTCDYVRPEPTSH